MSKAVFFTQSGLKYSPANKIEDLCLRHNKLMKKQLSLRLNFASKEGIEKTRSIVFSDCPSRSQHFCPNNTWALVALAVDSIG
jgi:hypothetical protein